ncbi:MAG TPA: serine hydrolase [candidate division Zixibacteria bacterium]|mgnify:FL=1|nr:serine hydrolase [candidate division Zixibacteria bacterium]MDD4918626.1 serine hydrolase [candidate division Zixibacteria bacterium]MDM7972006.1 serine hydrolase [candidate division Zixibacteria bacterium]HOD66057.1 serine hydrolase [candidate division Zixibacteria bacterium]HPM38450.1 serine hydrolase [candidate division Zixibacteria bacterium]
MSAVRNRLRASALAALAGVCLASGVRAADPSGGWEGSIDIPGSALAFTVEFSRDSAGAWAAVVDIPAQNAADLPVEGIIVTDDSLIFALAGIPGAPVFRGAFAADSGAVAGNFTQGGQAFPFSMTRLDVAARQARAAALADNLARIRSFIDTALAPWKVPGLAIAIVKDDSVLMMEGFGLRDRENNLPVTPRTLFPIGSSTKAFTTTALAMLVDSGLVEWDGRVRDYLPDFRLSDPEITDQATVRDLCTHRIGLPRHDLMWYSSDCTREEMYRRLRYLDFSKDFRSEFQYQNLMYMTAGYLVGRVAGTSWEEFVRARIFLPLGMTNSNFSIAELEKAPEFARGYEEKNDTLALMPYRPIEAIGPAGAINSSVDQMVNWIRLHLANGLRDTVRLVSEGQMIEMHSPCVSLDRAGGRYHETILTSYGLGWFIESYRGHYRVHHGGNIDGFSALASFLPDDRLGLVILTNKNGTPLPSIVANYVDDLLLGLEPVDYHRRALTQLAAADSSRGTEAQAAADRVPNTKPSHDLSAYAGEYEHPGYGVVTVSLAGVPRKDQHLRAVLHSLESDLEHWHYDVFRMIDEPLADKKARSFLSFSTNTFGDIDRLSVVLEPTLPPIEFVRRPDSRLSEPAYLAQFTGDYLLEQLAVTVAIQADRLTVTVPGQPTYTLLPYRNDEFTFRDLSGYSVAFDRAKDGRITGLRFKQPNGVFSAEKRTAEDTQNK